MSERTAYIFNPAPKRIKSTKDKFFKVEAFIGKKEFPVFYIANSKNVSDVLNQVLEILPSFSKQTKVKIVITDSSNKTKTFNFP